MGSISIVTPWMIFFPANLNWMLSLVPSSVFFSIIWRFVSRYFPLWVTLILSWKDAINAVFSVSLIPSTVCVVTFLWITWLWFLMILRCTVMVPLFFRMWIWAWKDNNYLMKWKKVLIRKIFSLKINFHSKSIFGWTFFGRKKFWSKKFWSNKLLAENKFGWKKNLGWKRFLVNFWQDIFWFHFWLKKLYFYLKAMICSLNLECFFCGHDSLPIISAIHFRIQSTNILFQLCSTNWCISPHFLYIYINPKIVTLKQCYCIHNVTFMLQWFVHWIP